MVWRRTEAGDESIMPTIGLSTPSDCSQPSPTGAWNCRNVARLDAANIHWFAQTLGRDDKNDHTDVRVREDPGLLERVDGNLVALFDQIDIRVALREAPEGLSAKKGQAGPDGMGWVWRKAVVAPLLAAAGQVRHAEPAGMPVGRKRLDTRIVTVGSHILRR